MNIPEMTIDAYAIYKDWLNRPGSANEIDLINMAVAARDAQWQAAMAGQEPVARVNNEGFIVEMDLLIEPGTLLYTHPAPTNPAAQERAEPVAPAVVEGWKEAAIAWTVCASIHEQWAKGKDALYKTQHADFERHANDARSKAFSATPPAPAQPSPEPSKPEQAEAPSDWEGLPLDEVHPEWRDALLDYQAQLQQANRRFVDVSVALMKYVPASEAAAKSVLQKLGDAHGYGWCQTALGQMWDEKHGCAPRGSMGVTVKDAAKQAVPDGYQLVMVPKLAPDDEPDWDECIRQSEEATGIKVERGTLSIVIREVRRWLAHRAALATKPQAEQEAGVKMEDDDRDKEIARLRDLLEINKFQHSHECGRCHLRYTPEENEDCPSCGFDGKDGAASNSGGAA